MTMLTPVTSLGLLGCFFLLHHHCSAFPNGAPTSACSSMAPSHYPGVAQTSSAPYEVRISVSSGIRNTIEVSVSLRSTDVGFMGFLIAAKDRAGKIIGQFDQAVSQTDDAKFLRCQNAPTRYSVVTHTSGSRKSEVSLKWSVSTAGFVDAYFSVTFVQKRDTFWVNVSSTIFTLPRPTTRTPTTTILQSTPNTPLPPSTVSTSTFWQWMSTAMTTTIIWDMWTTTDTTPFPTFESTTIPFRETSTMESTRTSPFWDTTTMESSSTTPWPSTSAVERSSTTPWWSTSAMWDMSSTTTRSKPTPTTRRPTQPPVRTTVGPIVEDKSCGNSSGCILDCTADSCSFLIKYRLLSANIIKFDIIAKVDRPDNIYMAIGFSEDKTMGDDGVAVCSMVNGRGDVRNYYNVPPPFKNSSPLEPPSDKAGISEVFTQMSNGIFVCSFSRAVSVPNLENFSDLRINWNVLFAHGVVGTDGELRHHSWRYATNSPVDFTLYGDNSTEPVTTPDSIGHACSIIVQDPVMLASLATLLILDWVFG